MRRRNGHGRTAGAGVEEAVKEGDKAGEVIRKEIESFVKEWKEEGGGAGAKHVQGSVA